MLTGLQSLGWFNIHFQSTETPSTNRLKVLKYPCLLLQCVVATVVHSAKVRSSLHSYMPYTQSCQPMHSSDKCFQ